MLQHVLSEGYKAVFREYGTIEIPKGTMVDYQSNEDSQAGYCPVGEFGWIDDRYPHQSQKMKADALKHGILIPKDKLSKALRVRFIYDDSGNCRDIYKAENREYNFCRMESRIEGKVQWLTVTPGWDEPDCPLRSGILIQIVDGKGKVTATEQQERINGESTGEKVFPFSWERPATQEEQHLKNRVYSL